MKHARPVYSPRAGADGFFVDRNGKALLTPLQFSLVVPTRALAEAIVLEFSAAGERTNFRKMPMTQMALTAIDVTKRQREEIIQGILRYGETELICLRAADPAELAAEQANIWDPYLAWCKTTFDADLRCACGIVPFEQNKSALAALRAFVETRDVFRLTGLSEACRTLGSLVLALALTEGRKDTGAVFEAAELDSLWQNKKWGDDPVTQGRYDAIKRDIEICSRWCRLLGE